MSNTERLSASAEAFLREPNSDAFFSLLDNESKRAAFIDFVARELLRRDHHSVFWGDRMLTLDKSIGFLSDPAFVKGWEHVRGVHKYDSMTISNRSRGGFIL